MVYDGMDWIGLHRCEKYDFNEVHEGLGGPPS